MVLVPGHCVDRLFASCNQITNLTLTIMLSTTKLSYQVTPNYIASSSNITLFPLFLEFIMTLQFAKKAKTIAGLNTSIR
jgi:hypothetical protein